MACTKVPYRDKATAVKAIHTIQNCKDGRKKPVRAYQCDNCNKWHLTSKPIATGGGNTKLKFSQVWSQLMNKK